MYTNLKHLQFLLFVLDKSNGKIKPKITLVFSRFRSLQTVFDLSDNHRGSCQTPIINPIGFKKNEEEIQQKNHIFKNKYRYTNVQYKLKGSFFF